MICTHLQIWQLFNCSFERRGERGSLHEIFDSIKPARQFMAVISLAAYLSLIAFGSSNGAESQILNSRLPTISDDSFPQTQTHPTVSGTFAIGPAMSPQCRLRC